MRLDALFEQLLTALQSAEKRHRAVRDKASDLSDWSTHDNEVDMISKIIKWRRSLESIRSEAVAAGIIAETECEVLPVGAGDGETVEAYDDHLSRKKPPATGDAFVFRKTVDWSTLNYGITIPIVNWETFFSAIGQTVDLGQSCHVSIEIDQSGSERFQAWVIHSVGSTKGTVQIRYIRTNRIVAVLRQIFKST